MHLGAEKRDWSIEFAILFGLCLIDTPFLLFIFYITHNRVERAWFYAVGDLSLMFAGEGALPGWVCWLLAGCRGGNLSVMGFGWPGGLGLALARHPSRVCVCVLR